MKTTAKLFKTGGSQAVRLPKAFRFPGKSVSLQRTKGGGTLMMPQPEPEQRMQNAAKTYAAFLRENPDELAAMDAWESAALAEAPSRRK